MGVAIEIFHNILWSKYKGGVFSKLSELGQSEGTPIRFTQIAETAQERVALGEIDLRYHTYPYALLFRGSYEAIPKWRIVGKLFMCVWRSNAQLIVLPGYDRAEYWAMLAATIMTGKKRAVFCDSTIHDRTQGRFKGWFKRLFFSSCDGYFGYGVRSGEYLEYYGASRQRIFVRCQAAALPLDYSSREAFEQRVLQTGAPASHRYLYVGRIAPEKGLVSLIHAFVALLQTHPASELRFVGSGPQQLELVGIVDQLGISANVKFLGSMDMDALGREYLAATCLVLPSFSEPWGLVVNEALSYGCPVVVSHRCGCVPELVIDGQTGFMFTAGDVEGLTAKMLAVPVVFADGEKTAHVCIEAISNYSPTRAATEILAGCKKILSG